MTTKIYCRNGHVVCVDPVQRREAAQHETVRSEVFGRDVSVPRGRAEGGIIRLDDTDAWVTSKSCHELEVLASGVADLAPGDRVIVYLGGDTDGIVEANGISAFVKVDGVERAVVHEAFVWAKVKDGEVLPRGRIVLTERNDRAFHRYTWGPGALIQAPDAHFEHGHRATGEESDQVLASVTALYEKVYRVGPDVRDLDRGAIVCFSPSFAATRLRRRVGEAWRFHHLCDSAEIFFEVAG